MRIDIITVLPEMLESPLNCSILKRAQNKGLAEIVVHDLREYSLDKHRHVDDYPFGGEAGMVMQIEPVDRCISALKAERDYDEVIFVTPDGEKFDQRMANTLSLSENLIILCGHYKGIDYRIREHFITKEITIGDYVLTGGELPAMALIDRVARFIPQVLGAQESATEESIYSGLLEFDQSTKPQNYEGMEVPEVLCNGNHKLIHLAQYRNSLELTQKRRPDLFRNYVEKQKDLTKEERKILEEIVHKTSDS